MSASQFVFSSEVATALQQGQPIVALESTIIAHGFSYPDNLALGRELENQVRAYGAVPATIAIRAGQVCVGVTDDVLVDIATNGASYRKAGATDLAVHVAARSHAATTVSATATIAAAAGIKVFATGGIGGVHRGDAMDISHDLIALGRTKLAVVSAGAKAILDLPKTLEVLESLGVLTIGFGCDEFPAFYTPRSGLRLEHRCDNVATLAKTIATHWAQFDGRGVLVAHPIPASAALSPELIETAIDEALAAAAAKQIVGKALTPFLLAALARITSGKSVEANRALALNNAQLGAKLAVALGRN